MARTRTLAELRTEVMDRGSLRAIRHTPTEVNRNINQAIAELYDLLVAANKDYFLSSQTVTVVSGTDTYALATDFYRCEGVDVYDGGRWYPVKRFNFSERNQYQDNGSLPRLTRYRVMGANMRLRPTPTWGGSMRMWYIPAATVLSGDSSTFDGICGWEEYVIVDCLIRARIKDEEGIEELMAQKEALIKRIKSMASERDDAEPDRVRDVDGEGVDELGVFALP